MTESNAGGRGSIWPVVVALLGWTAVVVAFLYFDPGSEPYWSNPLLCMRLVGRTAACQAGQNTINDAWQWLHFWPLLLACVSGYIAIVVVAIRGPRRRRGERPGDPAMTHG